MTVGTILGTIPNVKYRGYRRWVGEGGDVPGTSENANLYMGKIRKSDFQPSKSDQSSSSSVTNSPRSFAAKLQRKCVRPSSDSRLLRTYQLLAIFDGLYVILHFPVQPLSIPTVMDLLMAIWTDPGHPARVVRTAVGYSSSMMRFKVY
jgi:hypothetical protein